MTRNPVIFLAFANDDDDYLASLEEERDEIYRSLQVAHDAEYIEVYHDSNTTVDDMFEQFTRFNDRVAIFHYAGHASGTHLRLEGDTAANARGLAQLMGQQDNLQLVFLNGCSTLGQVKLLQEVGIKAIIATSVPINDNKALLFSKQFYSALAGDSTIKEAFDSAVFLLETKELLQKNSARVYRSMNFKEKRQEKSGESDLPWGLYVQDEKALDWKLPKFDKSIFTDPWVGTKIKRQEVNTHIILPLSSAMSEHNLRLAKRISLLSDASDEGDYDFAIREMMDLIIKNFPWPLGIKLRTLFSSHDAMIQKSWPRLEQIVSTYTRVGRFLLYILLSQLWDQIYEEDEEGENKFKISKPYQEQLEKFLANGTEGIYGFDHLELLYKTLEVLSKNQVALFVEELGQLLENQAAGSKINKAHIFFEQLKKDMREGAVKPGEVAELCDKAEFSLAEILINFSFLIKYKLISIKDIGISKQRRSLPLFKHQVGVLAGVTIDVMDVSAKDYNTFTDSHSILLVKEVGKVDQYLNLSPFIVDENAYKSQNVPKVYLYLFNKGMENFFYEHVDNDTAQNVPELKAHAHENPFLADEFKMFQKDLINRKS